MLENIQMIPKQDPLEVSSWSYGVITYVYLAFQVMVSIRGTLYL